ncbi:DUF192 domain-containing protein [Cyanobacteria bacterium FACHB-63]|nr:DUF192 domain-containing protein [Cyanobacteria bacterium FACHB-63]
MAISISPLVKPSDRKRWLQRANRVVLAGIVAGVLIRVANTSRQEAQILPVTAQVQIGRETISLEVAKTPEQRSRGLMYRTELASDRGMLFLFETTERLSFWMKNTLIPLDIVFLKDGEVRQTATAVPCPTEPCPVYSSQTPVNQVLELPAGRIRALGIKVGDRLIFQDVNQSN